MDATAVKQFENALHQVGEVRLRLDQIIAVYTRTFPSEAMRPDMRHRLHDALFDLSDCGVIHIPEDVMENYQDAELPAFVVLQDRPTLH